MMTREQVFEIITKERAFQDGSFGPEGVVSSGQTRVQRDTDVAPGILMLVAYADKATAAWVNTKGNNLPALQQVAKLAAIAVRILERAGGSEKLLESGLR